LERSLNVLWISPEGAGLSTAEKIRTAGNQLMVYPGIGTSVPELGTVARVDLWTWASTADLLVVDGPFPLTRTRSGSLRPSDESLFIDELRRHYSKIAIGPTPTIDLLVGDPRSLRKWANRLQMPYGEGPGGPRIDDREGGRYVDTPPEWSSGSWFRQGELLAPGPFLQPWAELFDGIGFRGWFELLGYIDMDGPVVTAANATWADDTIPEGQEAEFLQALC
jgi:hypothetical protein